MFGLESLRETLMGDRPVLPPPSHDDPEEVAAILAQLEQKMPTLERGQAWLTQARTDLPFLDHHRQTVLGAVPALRVSATSSWIHLMEAPGWDPELDSYSLVRLLAAMLAWQVAASQRALERMDIAIDGLPLLVWSQLVEESERYLTDQSASDVVLRQLREVSDKLTFMVELALDAPEADDIATDLVTATQAWCGLRDQVAAVELLASQWRIMDVAAIGVWYRSFGEQLQRQSVV